MRSASSAISLTTHVAIVAAVVLGTANARPKEPERPDDRMLVLGPIVQRHDRGGLAPLPNGPQTVVVPWIPVPTIPVQAGTTTQSALPRSEEHTSELQSRLHLVCRLLLEKKKSISSCEKLVRI